MSAPSLEVLLDEDEIDTIVGRLAAEISAAYPRGVVLVGVLKGSVVFLSDLVRRLTIDPLVDFLAVTPYAPDTGRVRLVKDLDLDIGGHDVVLVEEIVDSGLTIAFLRAALLRRNPASVEVCTLLDRVSRRIVPEPLAFVGASIPDRYVVGYGLDHQGRYRNLSSLSVADPALLDADADAYVPALYG